MSEITTKAARSGAVLTGVKGKVQARHLDRLGRDKPWNLAETSYVWQMVNGRSMRCTLARDYFVLYGVRKKP
jgi:hypothetical protein